MRTSVLDLGLKVESAKGSSGIKPCEEVILVVKDIGSRYIL